MNQIYPRLLHPLDTFTPITYNIDMLLKTTDLKFEAAQKTAERLFPLGSGQQQAISLIGPGEITSVGGLEAIFDRIIRYKDCYAQLTFCELKFNSHTWQVICRLLPLCHDLRTLEFCGCALTEPQILDLDHILSHLKRDLLRFFLTRNPLPSVGRIGNFQNFFKDNSVLNELHLDGNQIGDAGLPHVLKAIASLNQLEVISLKDNSLKDESTVNIEQWIRTNAELTALGVEETEKCLPKHIILDSNNITNNGLEHLVSFLRDNSQMKVSLNLTEIDDAGVNYALDKLGDLFQLSLLDNPKLSKRKKNLIEKLQFDAQMKDSPTLLSLPLSLVTSKELFTESAGMSRFLRFITPYPLTEGSSPPKDPTVKAPSPKSILSEDNYKILKGRVDDCSEISAPLWDAVQALKEPDKKKALVELFLKKQFMFDVEASVPKSLYFAICKACRSEKSLDPNDLFNKTMKLVLFEVNKTEPNNFLHLDGLYVQYKGSYLEMQALISVLASEGIYQRIFIYDLYLPLELKEGVLLPHPTLQFPALVYTEAKPISLFLNRGYYSVLTALPFKQIGESVRKKAREQQPKPS